MNCVVNYMLLRIGKNNRKVKTDLSGTLTQHITVSGNRGDKEEAERCWSSLPRRRLGSIGVAVFIGAVVAWLLREEVEIFGGVTVG